MKTVGDVLRHKGSLVHTITPDASVFQALRQMAEHDVGALIVVERGDVVGILSERDYARKVILRGEKSTHLDVGRIMSTRIAVVTREATVEGCMQIMTEQRVRHLPVIDDGMLCGIVSIGDVVKAVIKDQEFVIEQLEEYIRTAG